MKRIRNAFVAKLLAWHQKNALRFPWRETKDTYKILLAEVLLRKTTRDQVSKIFPELIKKYPRLELLASADVAELEKIIEPLGMQKKRSILLIKLARYILNKHNGKVPEDINELRKIPGIGLYTANAILCLAYNRRLPLVDTNVLRVVERVFQIKSRKARARTDPKMWSFVWSLIPKGKAREFNLAMLDFANLICTHKSPKCPTCPIKNICRYPNKNKALNTAKRPFRSA
jgi:A/G-specific adenine glycosylase